MPLTDVEQLSRQLLEAQGIARVFESRNKSLREENRDLERKLEEKENELKVMREWLKK